MNIQLIASTLLNDFELRSMELLDDNIGYADNQRGIIQTLRASNQTEIRTLLTKFKRLFHELIEQALQYISEEANTFFQKEHSQLYRLYAEIENLKKQMGDKENKITDLVIDNLRLQSTIQTLPQQDVFDQLIAKYQNDLMALQQQIEDKINIINKNQFLQNELRERISGMEQQILKLQQAQTVNVAIVAPEKPENRIVNNQIIQTQLCQADYSNGNIQESPSCNLSMNNSTEICSKSNQYITIRSKSICIANEEKGQENQKKQNSKVNKLPQMDRATNRPLKSTNHYSTTQTQMIDLKSLLASFKNNNPKQMDSIYLFTRAKRRTFNTNVDVYYEPPSYRFKLNTQSNK